MDSIYQRLKEMGPDTFQRFSFQLLKEQHPGLEIRHVEGQSGDEGVDVFLGDLDGKPTIWQCKAFPNGVGDSQKEQIRKSLRTALRHFSPSFWILCLSIDMDTKAYRWFQKLKKSYASKVTVGLMPASDFVNEVLHRRSLRNHFFPNAAIDVLELKRLVTRTGEMNLDELEHITDANLEDIIERWKERDARFNYQIVFDGDLGPPQSRGDGPIPTGLVASIFKEGKTINVFARDVASLRANPPQFHTTIKGTGVKKYQAFLKTGVPQEFEADELGAFETDWPLLNAAVGGVQPQKLRVATSPAITSKTRSVRLEFLGNTNEIVRYELMKLRPVRTGVEEFEFSLSGKNVPFTISVVASIPVGDASMTFHLDASQRNPKAIKKSLDALNLFRPSGTLRVFDLETEKPLLEPVCSLPDETPLQIGRRAFINDVVAIADCFRVDLELPDKVTEEDLETISLLKQYMESGTAEIDNMTFGIAKSEENRELLPKLFATGRGFFRLANMLHEPKPILFGTPIDTGPVLIETEAEIVDLPSVLQIFEEAAIGESVKMSLHPIAPVQVSLSSGKADDVSFLPAT